VPRRRELCPERRPAAVAAATRARVMAAVAELEITGPNGVARIVRTKRTRVLAVILPDMQAFSPNCREVELAALPAFHPAVGNTMDDPAAASFAQSSGTPASDGVIVVCPDRCGGYRMLRPPRAP